MWWSRDCVVGTVVSWWPRHRDVRSNIAFEAGILAVTGGVGCSSVSGGIDASGTLVVFDSDCDTDSSGSIGAADALRVLKKAVGQNIALSCS